MLNLDHMAGAYPGSYDFIERALLSAPVVSVGEWHAVDVSSSPAHATHELEDVTLAVPIPAQIDNWVKISQPNMPWAEVHFQERVSSYAFNPPPSHEIWPYGNTGTHIQGNAFSHTYPERFWPKHAGHQSWACPHQVALPAGVETCDYGPRFGIRYEWGDLRDLVAVLSRNPLSRQAYLPIWFPEDLTAARESERVPCSLGYHFMIRNNRMTVRYFMRSCEFKRHLRDDIYMAGRLVQWLCQELNQILSGPQIVPARVIMHITSLHLLVGDRPAT